MWEKVKRVSKRTYGYLCGYCGKIFKSYKIADRHERACLKNPNAKNCVVCKHIIKDHTGIDKNGNEFSKSICGIDKCVCSKSRSADCDYFEHI